jgi:hypothetical protein
MRGPKPAPLELNEREQKALEELARRYSTSQQIALRGRMILAAAQGKNNAQIGRELGVKAVSLEDLDVSERLSDLPRPGRPAQITAEQTCQMIALAGA